MTVVKPEDILEVYGSFNDLSVGDTTPTASRRTLTTTEALSSVLEAYYTPDVLKGKSVYDGLVLACIPTTSPTIQSNQELIEYLAETTEDRVFQLYYVYKVLVPEVDPRPINFSQKKSPSTALTTAQRVMTLPSAIIDLSVEGAAGSQIRLIQPGTYVQVIYNNQERLKHPKVVGIGKKTFDIAGKLNNTTTLKAKFAMNSQTARPGTSRPISPYGGKPYPGDFTPGDNDELAYDLPIQGKTTIETVSSPYANRIHPITNKPDQHMGLDIAEPTGTPLVALADGEVIFAKGPQMSDAAGWYVVIKYEDKINGGALYSRYLHMRDKALHKKGDLVARGDVVGYVGNTGNSTGPHLHWELGKKSREGGSKLGELFDPIAYYPEDTFTDRSTGEALVLESHPEHGAA